jgi:hypothetical protein
MQNPCRLLFQFSWQPAWQMLSTPGGRPCQLLNYEQLQQSCNMLHQQTKYNNSPAGCLPCALPSASASCSARSVGTQSVCHAGHLQQEGSPQHLLLQQLLLLHRHLICAWLLLAAGCRCCQQPAEWVTAVCNMSGGGYVYVLYMVSLLQVCQMCGKLRCADAAAYAVEMINCARHALLPAARNICYPPSSDVSWAGPSQAPLLQLQQQQRHHPLEPAAVAAGAAPQQHNVSQPGSGEMIIPHEYTMHKRGSIATLCAASCTPPTCLPAYLPASATDTAHGNYV